MPVARPGIVGDGDQIAKRLLDLYQVSDMLLVVSRILEELREQIEASEKTRYAISKETGIDQAQLSRFVNGRQGLGIDALERLCDCLEMEIVIRNKKRRRKTKG